MCTSLGFNGQFSYILLDYIIVSLLKLSFDYKENSYVHFTLHHLQPIEQRGYFEGFKYVLDPKNSTCNYPGIHVYISWLQRSI